jgi:putative membrane protein
VRALVVRWLLLTLALLVTVHVLSAVGVGGIELWGGSFRLALAALAIGALNLLAHPVLWLAKLLTFPLSCLTLGLWTLFLSLFVNGLVFYFVGRLGWGFRVDGFLAAMAGALVMSAINAFLNGLFAFAVHVARGPASR